MISGTCYDDNWEEMPKSSLNQAALIDAIRESCRGRTLIFDLDIDEKTKAELCDTFLEEPSKEHFRHVSFKAYARRLDGKKVIGWSGERGSLKYALRDLHEFLQSVPDDERWFGQVFSDEDVEVFSIEWTPKAEMKPDPDAYRGYFTPLQRSVLAVGWSELCGRQNLLPEVGIEWKDEDGDWAERDCDIWLPYDAYACAGDYNDTCYAYDQIRYAYDPDDIEPYSLMGQAVCRANGFAWDYEKFSEIPEYACIRSELEKEGVLDKYAEDLDSWACDEMEEDTREMSDCGDEEER